MKKIENGLSIVQLEERFEMTTASREDRQLEELVERMVGRSCQCEVTAKVL